MAYRRVGWIGDLFVIGIVSSVNCIEFFDITEFIVE